MFDTRTLRAFDGRRCSIDAGRWSQKAASLLRNRAKEKCEQSPLALIARAARWHDLSRNVKKASGGVHVRLILRSAYEKIIFAYLNRR